LKLGVITLENAAMPAGSVAPGVFERAYTKG
jgi:hypothetical protein